MNTARGLFLESSLLHNLIVSIWAPIRPSTTIKAASHERKAQIASPIKSAVPGVSIMFIVLPSHVNELREACTEIFLAISSSV